MGDEHPLEEAFQLSAHEILNVIQSRNRCLIAVRGAVAEEHLCRELARLEAKGIIQDFTVKDKDGQPDFTVYYGGQSFEVECKNVEKEKRNKLDITIDFKRTRNPTGSRNPSVGAEGRFYKPEEFDVLGACLWNRTREWRFAFVATKDLPRHADYPDRLWDKVTVPLNNGVLSEPWSFDPIDILSHLKK